VSNWKVQNLQIMGMLSLILDGRVSCGVPKRITIHVLLVGLICDLFRDDSIIISVNVAFRFSVGRGGPTVYVQMCAQKLR
jgi:hypothetical protein